MKAIFYLCASVLLLQACSTPSNTFVPTTNFDRAKAPTAPDYAQEKYWAALPSKADAADKTPNQNFRNNQDRAEADVFFIHPTILIGTQEGQTQWNGSLEDEWLNNETDNSAIMHQASIFNAAGRIYAPRYRQAHLYVYYTKTRFLDAMRAMDLAYQDVKAAFEYYLEHHNNGRPIIIASHSQGTNHAERLLLEFFDEQKLREQLVTAYLVGMPIPRDTFETIKPCETPEETGCFCSWNTYTKDYYPIYHPLKLSRSVATNPLNWTIDGTYADYALNQGAVLRNFKVKKNLVDAQSQEGMLWIGKPKLAYSFLIKEKNWHVADYNLFYVSIRENAKLRVESFLKSQRAASN